jgi:transposase
MTLPEKAKRRTFTAKYKFEILAESDAAPEGEGGVVAREGLYHAAR